MAGTVERAKNYGRDGAEVGPRTYMLSTGQKVRIEKNCARGLYHTMKTYDEDNQTILAK